MKLKEKEEITIDQNDNYKITLKKISERPERYAIIKVGMDWEKNEIDMRIVLDKRDIEKIGKIVK